MLTNFLHIYEAIKVVINSSKSKAFKNKGLLFTNIEIIFLNNILKIISIFVKITSIIKDKLIIYLKEKQEDRKLNIKTLVFY
jgi:hypothetical protein